MGRRAVPLDTGTTQIPEGSCAACTRWILAPLDSVGLNAAGASAARAAWRTTVLETWGVCGQVLLDGPRDAQRPVGVVTYAPAALLPGLAALPTAPPAREAVVMVDLVVTDVMPAVVGAKLLVQAMAKDLVRREIALVETFADARLPLDAGADGCHHSQALLEGVGFAVQRPHARHPRMRLDLRTALTWLDEVGQALGRVRGGLAPQPRPHPHGAPRDLGTQHEAARTAHAVPDRLREAGGTGLR